MSKAELIQMLDLTDPAIVEIKIRSDSRVFWVNVDGICRLRVCAPPGKKLKLGITDERKG